MPDVIEPALSARAKCRGCGEPIAKGELRFGEALPNAFGEGESTFWFHLNCGACMRPEKFGPALDAQSPPPPDADWLKRAVEDGITHRRLPRLLRVERAKSGRATCRSCREVIDKGAFRAQLQMFEEGRFSPIGSFHGECASAYFGTKDLLDRMRKLTPSLTDADAEEIVRLLAVEKPAAAKSDEGDASPEGETGAAS